MRARVGSFGSELAEAFVGPLEVLISTVCLCVAVPAALMSPAATVIVGVFRCGRRPAPQVDR